MESVYRPFIYYPTWGLANVLRPEPVSGRRRARKQVTSHIVITYVTVVGAANIRDSNSFTRALQFAPNKLCL